MNPNQNQPNNQIPSIKQPGNWSPLNDPTYDLPPPKKSFFSKYKKLIIISSVAVILLVGLAIVESLGSSNSASTNLEGAKTSVELSNYDGQKFSMSYAKSMNIVIDEPSEDSAEWYLMFGKDIEESDYTVSVYLTEEAPFYADSEEGAREQLGVGVEPTNLVTSDVVVAGVSTPKTVGEYSQDGKDYYVAYTDVKIGDQYLSISATYPTDNAEIHDSFDAMVGSIKLKQ
jgi:hypothetical protein